MKSLSLGAFAFAALFSVTPVSPHWSTGGGSLVSVGVTSADAADLAVAPRHRTARHSRLYDPYCNGPYTGGWNAGVFHGDYTGGWNGGTYHGGPWMLLHCYGIAPEAYVPAHYVPPVNYYGYDHGYSPGYNYGYW